MTSERIIHAELSYQIMEAVFEVHNTLGPGFLESIYEEALAYELELRCIPFEQQKPVDIYYKGKLVGSHRMDMIIDKLVVLELKAIADLTDAHKKQVRSYLKATQLDLGILINFATPSVQYKRIANERDTQISKNP